MENEKSLTLANSSETLYQADHQQVSTAMAFWWPPHEPPTMQSMCCRISTPNSVRMFKTKGFSSALDQCTMQDSFDLGILCNPKTVKSYIFCQKTQYQNHYFHGAKMHFKVNFPRFKGWLKPLKLFSVFSFWHWQCHFWDTLTFKKTAEKSQT